MAISFYLLSLSRRLSSLRNICPRLHVSLSSIVRPPFGRSLPRPLRTQEAQGSDERAKGDGEAGDDAGDDDI